MRVTSSASDGESGGRIPGSARDQRLAGPGRPDHQQVVAAGGRDLERALEGRLAAHVAQVDQPGRAVPVRGERGHRRQLGRGVAVQLVDPAGLVGVDGRDVDAAQAGVAGDQDHRQHAGRVAQGAVERELTQEGRTGERLERQLPAGAQKADRDREPLRTNRPSLGARVVSLP
jgi:hypothetical protein